MATLQNYLSLRDGVSPVLERMSRASNAVADRLNRVATAAQSAGASAEVATSKFGMLGSVFFGSLAANVAMQAIGAVQNALGSLISTADEYASINARLKLIGGSQENAIYLNEQIYQSALRARGGYLDMAQAVATLATSAKDAFPDPREAVKFTEGINKLFTIGGVSGENKKFAMTQLTQGMASGALMGDEFRSISENAPIIQDMIAKTMGVARGELKGLASEGKITAEVIRNAILGNMDEINAKFREMPQTWADQRTWLSSNAVHSFAPVMQQLNNLANSDGVRRFVDGIVSGINSVAQYIYALINNIMWFGNVAYDVISAVGSYIGSWISAGFTIAGQGVSTFIDLLVSAIPIAVGAVLGLSAAWVILNTEMLLSNAAAAIQATWQGILAAKAVITAGAIAALSTAKAIWSAITMGAAGAQLMLSLVVGLLTGNVLLLASIIAGVAIAAFLAWKLASSDLASGIADAMDFIIDATETAVNSASKLVNGFIDLLNKAGQGLNKVFGTNIGAIEHVGTVNFQGAKQWSQAVRDGNFVEKFKNTVGGFLTPQMPENISSNFDKSKLPAVEAYDPNGKENAKNAKKTADNTQKLADNIEMSDEEINELRDSTMNSVLQQWQNQKVDINIVNNNTISNDMDLDGVTSDLVRGIREAWSAKGEGVLV